MSFLRWMLVAVVVGGSVALAVSFVLTALLAAEEALAASLLVSVAAGGLAPLFFLDWIERTER